MYRRKISKILDDELLAGWVGRLALTHGLQDERHVSQFLVGDQREPSVSLRHMHLNLIASMCDLSVDSLLLGHSLAWPLLFHLTSTKTALQEEFLQKRSLWSLFPLVWIRACPDCSQSDVRDYGFSYWRRAHQLPGAEICDVHRGRLACFERSRMWAKLPHHLFDATNVQTNPGRFNRCTRTAYRMLTALIRPDHEIARAGYLRYVAISAVDVFGNNKIDSCRVGRVLGAAYPIDWVHWHRQSSTIWMRGYCYGLARIFEEPESAPPLAIALVAGSLGCDF
jgi:hypothetical protein